MSNLGILLALPNPIHIVPQPNHLLTSFDTDFNIPLVTQQ